jgi:signal transduction histidine kinase
MVGLAACRYCAIIANNCFVRYCSAVLPKNRDFKSYINHEIRNPLNVIKGLTDYSLEMLRNVHQDVVPNRETVSADKTTLDTAVSDLQGKIDWLAVMLF